MSSGSNRAERAVEPTRSQNITVRWRRSAASLRDLSIARRASRGGTFVFASARRAAMASRSFRRCPTIPTPKSFKSSAVKAGRTVSSISFSRNAAFRGQGPAANSRRPSSRPYSGRRMIIQAKQSVQALILEYPGDVRCMTVLPPKADVHPRSCYVAFVPVPDSCTAAN
jgi:hypothetical protein